MYDFFKEIFKGKPDDHFITLWTLHDKRTYWYQSIEELTEGAEEHELDLFYGLGTSIKKTVGRILQKDVRGIGCIHVDIDYGESGHNKSNLPPDQNTAIEIAELIVPPSIIVESGHGIHGYYLFKQYQTNDIDRIRRLQKLFQQTTNHLSNYEIDMTHDVSRILRVPGSNNCKNPEEIKQAYVLVDNSQLRYTVEDLEQTVDKMACKKIKRQPVSQPLPFKKIDDPNYTGKSILYAEDLTDDEKYRKLNDRLELNPSRELSSKKFMTLMEVFDPEFSALYHHTKKLPHDNNSCSGYDLALANMAAKVDFNEQEIADLLIMHRQSNNAEQMKFTHPYYYGRTIFKAMLAAETQAVKQKTKQPDNKQSPTVKLARQVIRTALGINVHQIIKYPSDPEPIFFLKLTPDGREIKLGNFRLGVKNYDNFFGAIQGELAGNTKGIRVKLPSKKKEWPELLSALYEIIIEKDVAEDMFVVGKIKSWLRAFSMATTVNDSIKEFFENGDMSACISDGSFFYMNEDTFLNWVKCHRAHELTATEVKIALMQVGGALENISYQDDKAKMWKLDQALVG